MKYIKLFEKFDDSEDNYEDMSLKDKLYHYGIKNHKLNADETIDIEGDVNFNGMMLNKIPFKFGKVTGDFGCLNNRLTSLEGCPYYVGGDFSCNDNDLTNLIGGPEEVNGSYTCHHNKLKSLEGCAAEIGGNLDCRWNDLKDFNISSYIKGNLQCWANPIDEDNYQFYGEIGGKIIF